MPVSLKQELITKINSIEDQEVLLELSRILELETEIDRIYELTTTEKDAINTGLKDIDEGRVYTTQEARGKIKKWLKK